MLLFKATYISSVNKSLAELLNARKYNTHLSTIDLSQGINEPEIETLAEKCQKSNVTVTGKELPKLDV